MVSSTLSINDGDKLSGYAAKDACGGGEKAENLEESLLSSPGVHVEKEKIQKMEFIVLQIGEGI